MSKRKLWTKDFVIISFANFFVALSFYLLMTTLAVYALEEFSASQSEAGLAASIFVIGAIFSRLFTGKYIEVVGRRKLLYGSLLLFLIATILYFPVSNLNLLLLVRFIHGAAFGSASTVMSTAAMDMIPMERKGEGTSYFMMSASAATAIGPFLGLFITQHTDFSMVFVVCTVFSIITILISLFINIPEADITPDQLQEMKLGFKLKDFFEKKALPISTMMVFMGIAYSGIVSFINSYAIEIQLQDAASVFFIVYAVFLLISRPIAGRLQDVKGDNIIIYPSLVMFTLSLFLLSQAQSGFILLLSGGLLALGFGTMLSSAQAIAVKESPRHRVGLAASTFYICLDGGVGIGPFLIGFLIPLVGYRGMYLTMAVIVFLSIFLYYFLHGKKASARKRGMLADVSNS